MAHTGIFATLAECTSKAGDNVSTDGFVEANINQWCSEAESFINILTGVNFSDLYSTMNSDVKKILSEAESNLVAIYSLQYKMTGDDGTKSRIEAEDQINILWARFESCIEILKGSDKVKFMQGA